MPTCLAFSPPYFACYEMALPWRLPGFVVVSANEIAIRNETRNIPLCEPPIVGRIFCISPKATMGRAPEFIVLARLSRIVSRVRPPIILSLES